jgi:hypothetical protein
MNENKMKIIIDSFPRKRSVLSSKYQKVYVSHYKSNRNGDTSASLLAQRMEAWMHKKVAADLIGDDIRIQTLEIGAGTLNQLKYEPITTYDIIEPFKELFINSTEINKVNHVYNDIRNVKNKKYDRITSIAVFEHITDLTFVVAKTCLLLANNGTLKVAIPNEGTILWKMGWMFTTGLEFRLKYNLKYSTLLYHEHVNNATDIEMVLKYFYSDIKCSVFGLNKKFGFYRYYECKNPIPDIAEQFLCADS